MTDETGGDGQRAPMVWALAVNEGTARPAFAEAIIEVGLTLHGELVEQAVDSGFVLAAGEAPPTTAVVEVVGDRLARLVLVGGRQLWEPAQAVVASPRWLSVARDRGWVAVLVVPPGTWPPGLMELEPAERVDAFTRSLEQARADGLVLHGTAVLRWAGPADG